MREFIVYPPMERKISLENANGLCVTLTDDDISDLNDGHGITTIAWNGEEIALFPQMSF